MNPALAASRAGGVLSTLSDQCGTSLLTAPSISPPLGGADSAVDCGSSIKNDPFLICDPWATFMLGRDPPLHQPVSSGLSGCRGARNFNIDAPDFTPSSSAIASPSLGGDFVQVVASLEASVHAQNATIAILVAELQLARESKPDTQSFDARSSSSPPGLQALQVQIDEVRGSLKHLASSLGDAVQQSLDLRTSSAAWKEMETKQAALGAKFEALNDNVNEKLTAAVSFAAQNTADQIKDTSSVLITKFGELVSLQNRDTSTRIIDKLPVLAKSIRDECVAKINALSEEFRAHVTTAHAKEASLEACLVANKMVLPPPLEVASACGKRFREMPCSTFWAIAADVRARLPHLDVLPLLGEVGPKRCLIFDLQLTRYPSKNCSGVSLSL